MPDLPREGAKNHKHEHTVTLGPGCGWTMYPGPMLNVRDQHSQSGFHSIPQELVCFLLPGREKRKQSVSGLKAGAQCYPVYSDGGVHQLEQDRQLHFHPIGAAGVLSAILQALLGLASWGQLVGSESSHP